jgi:anti-sigma factor RsiW
VEQPAPQEVAQRNWMDAVAQYVSLFSQETLAGMPADPAAREAGLQRVSSALGKLISQDKVAAIPSLDFRGTQLLQLEGRPIAQIAFQSETGKPVAICIIKTARPAENPSQERRLGLNIVHWVADGYGYMVIGDVPQDALTRISEAARAQLS